MPDSDPGPVSNEEAVRMASAMTRDAHKTLLDPKTTPSAKKYAATVLGIGIDKLIALAAKSITPPPKTTGDRRDGLRELAEMIAGVEVDGDHARLVQVKKDTIPDAESVVDTP